MSLYGWGVDGYGRKHICYNRGREVLLCVIPGCSIWECIDILDYQLRNS